MSGAARRFSTSCR